MRKCKATESGCHFQYSLLYIYIYVMCVVCTANVYTYSIQYIYTNTTDQILSSDLRAKIQLTQPFRTYNISKGVAAQLLQKYVLTHPNISDWESYGRPSLDNCQLTLLHCWKGPNSLNSWILSGKKKKHTHISNTYTEEHIPFLSQNCRAPNTYWIGGGLDALERWKYLTVAGTETQLFNHITCSLLPT